MDPNDKPAQPDDTGLLAFVRQNKIWWIAPPLILLLLLVIVLVGAGGAPYIYHLF